MIDFDTYSVPGTMNRMLESIFIDSEGRRFDKKDKLYYNYEFDVEIESFFSILRQKVYKSFTFTTKEAEGSGEDIEFYNIIEIDNYKYGGDISINSSLSLTKQETNILESYVSEKAYEETNRLTQDIEFKLKNFTTDLFCKELLIGVVLNLRTIIKSVPLKPHPVEELLFVQFSNSYSQMLHLIQKRFGYYIPHLFESKEQLIKEKGFKETESKTQNLDILLLSFIKEDKLIKFREIERYLISKKILIERNEGLEWVGMKKSLIYFYLFLKHQGFFYPAQDYKRGVMKKLEYRYNQNMGDQSKPSSIKKIKNKDVNEEFYHLLKFL